MRRVFIAALALIVVATAAVGVTAAVTPDSNGVSRVGRVYSKSWGGTCGLDFCGIADHPRAVAVLSLEAS
jgi:hypothetical protein